MDHKGYFRFNIGDSVMCHSAEYIVGGRFLDADTGKLQYMLEDPKNPLKVIIREERHASPVLSSREHKTCVYFVHSAIRDGHYLLKIGISRDPEQRFRQLKAIHGQEFHVLHILWCENAREAEQWLHSHYVSSGKWAGSVKGATEFFHFDAPSEEFQAARIRTHACEINQLFQEYQKVAARHYENRYILRDRRNPKQMAPNLSDKEG